MLAQRSLRHGLKDLHIKLVSLSPQMFDLLAEKLPGLYYLSVRLDILLSDVKGEGITPLDGDAGNNSVSHTAAEHGPDKH